MKRVSYGKVKNISGSTLKVGKSRVADGEILETPLYNVLLRLYPKYWELVEEAEKVERKINKKADKKEEVKEEKKEEKKATKKKSSKK